MTSELFQRADREVPAHVDQFVANSIPTLQLAQVSLIDSNDRKEVRGFENYLLESMSAGGGADGLLRGMFSIMRGALCW